MTEFDPKSLQGIARHVRKMLGSIKTGPKNRRELAYALAAAKIVVSTLEEACREARVTDEVFAACDELAADSDRVLELTRWRR